jgi:hypothetical protein
VAQHTDVSTHGENQRQIARIFGRHLLCIGTFHVDHKVLSVPVWDVEVCGDELLIEK